MSDALLYEKDGGIGLITLNRPDKMNSLLPEMTDRLEELSDEIEHDDQVGVVIITGAGDKAFCAGGDLAEGVPDVAENGLEGAIADPARRFFSQVTKPLIAAVNGVCVAGGMELVLGTDLRIASETASFGIPESRWGIFPAGGATVRLPSQIPWARAMELLLVGGMVPAEEALSFGLVNRVVPQDEVLPTAQKFAERIMRNGPVAVRKIKESAVRARALTWTAAFESEYELAAEVFKTEDAKEGLRAFAEKRPPVYTGR
ncbi:enoyl-CoA hydratase/isomerase family protein [Rhodococcus sp. WS4]|nr:enoyl-CoA hydratase/isomerase family protein [Rhodococcus sp. WS4]